MTRRCLICANVNPCREHSETAQLGELARNDRAIADIKANGKPRCDECDCILPAHYGSCSKASGIMVVKAEMLEEGPEIVAVRRHKARLVREALRSLSNEPGCGDYFTFLANSASDEALCKLQRLIK